MWRCPKCAIILKLNQNCTSCKREIQNFENVYGYDLAAMLIEVPIDPEAKKKEQEAEKAPDSYWRCKICQITQLISQDCSRCHRNLERSAQIYDLDELLISGPDALNQNVKPTQGL